MPSFDEILQLPPFSLAKEEKTALFTSYLKTLTNHHYQNCSKYKSMLDALDFDVDSIKTYYDLPFLPVSLFKEMELKSISDEEVFKITTSSGTSYNFV